MPNYAPKSVTAEARQTNLFAPDNRVRGEDGSEMIAEGGEPGRKIGEGLLWAILALLVRRVTAVLCHVARQEEVPEPFMLPPLGTGPAAPATPAADTKWLTGCVQRRESFSQRYEQKCTSIPASICQAQDSTTGKAALYGRISDRTAETARSNRAQAPE